MHFFDLKGLDDKNFALDAFLAGFLPILVHRTDDKHLV